MNIRLHKLSRIDFLFLIQSIVLCDNRIIRIYQSYKMHKDLNIYKISICKGINNIPSRVFSSTNIRPSYVNKNNECIMR